MISISHFPQNWNCRGLFWYHWPSNQISTLTGILPSKWFLIKLIKTEKTFKSKTLDKRLIQTFLVQVEKAKKTLFFKSKKQWKIFWQIWISFDQFGHLWTNFCKFSTHWTSLCKFGQVWSALDMLGPIWSNSDTILTSLNKFEQLWSKISHHILKPF